ncbi:MAG: 5'-3' exonuclease H3TH domain-containing protein, partial [Paeniclostridium sordellii]|nr:5'-3' exonuclease H3TH domain-containing protein [Paeniclostridium sordellii]
MQLVNDQVTVLYPRKGVSDLARMTPEGVEEKYLVPPARYPELAALVGESADHLPGVPGVGPKTAVKWLNTYDGLENLIREADTVRGKAGQSFRDHLDDVIRNRKLNALVRDLDLDVTLADLARQPWDPKATRAVFDTLEFRTLWDRVRALASESDADEVVEIDEALDVSGAVLEPGTLGDWLSTAEGRIGVNVTGTWGSGSGDVEAVALGAGDGTAVWFDTADLGPGDEKAFAQWLTDEAHAKAMHSAKGPVEALAERGWEVKGLTCDTELASYLLHPDRRTHKFDDAVRKGVRKDGSTLYPAMPYPSFARISEADMRAMYAYFMHGVEPVNVANKDTDIPWPLSMRWPLAFWRGIFAPTPSDFVANPQVDPVLERGRYLVEGLGHCGACHTPRSLTMQEKALSESEGDDYLAGSNAPIDGWVASSLRGENRDGLGTWSEAELAEFLKTGRNDK